MFNYSSAYFYGVETVRGRRTSLSGRRGKGTRFSYMSLSRRVRLASVLICLYIPFALAPAWSQTQPQAEPAKPSTNQTQPQQPEQEPKKANPFETVPQTAPPAPAPAPAPQQPGKPQMEAPKTPEAPAPAPAGNVIEAIEFRGSRRVPQDTLRALIFTKKGDVFNEDALHRDFMALWNTGRFDDIRLETEPGKSGLLVRFVVTERRVIRTIKYGTGMKSVTVSEVLDRFKERKVGLSVESQYDPNKVQRAAVVLKEYLAERGRQFATVDPEIRQVPPSSLEVTFNVNEGPKVKVGKIDIQGNQHFSDKDVIRAMKNLHPIGVPHAALHIGGTASEDAPGAHFSAKGIARPTGASGNHVHMPVEVQHRLR